MSENPRFWLLNEQICAARGEDARIAIEGPEQLTHVGNIMAEAACTSVQCHLQVSPESFGSYWNAAQAIAGVQVAVGANSPYLFGRELWRETRITLFQQATDTRPEELQVQGVRPRVWFGERWITSVFDLFEENIRYFPALLPLCADEDPLAELESGAVPELAELTLHNGTVYRWNRPVYDVTDGRPACRWKTGCCRRPDRGGHHRQRGVLLRAGPRPGRRRAADLDPDVVRGGRGEPDGGGPARHRRVAVLAGPGRGAGHRAHAAAAAAPGPRGPGPVGRGAAARRPLPRHHRAALPRPAGPARPGRRRPCTCSSAAGGSTGPRRCAG